MFGSNEENCGHKYGSGNDSYVSLPPMLLNTAGLEIYLRNLNQKLQVDLTELKKEINTSREEVTAAFVSVNQMKRYLGERAIAEMKGVITETSSVLEQFHHGMTDNNNSEIETDSSECKKDENVKNKVICSVQGSTRNNTIGNNEGENQESGVSAWFLQASGKLNTVNNSNNNKISSDDTTTDQHQVESVDTFEGMMMVAKELMNENRELRKALIKSTEVNEETKRLHAQLYANVAQSNERMSRFQHDFNKLSQWLGTFNMFDIHDESFATTTVGTKANLEFNATSINGFNVVDDITLDKAMGAHGGINVNGGEDVTVSNEFTQEQRQKEFTHPEMNLPSPEEVETFLARSPLLLAFRRILLRDLSLRLAHNSEIQSRDVGETISNLKQNINDCVTPQHVLAMINNTQDNKANELMRNFADRLKAIESNYVTREEYVTSIGTKADSLMMPIKADSIAVSELSQQLNNRCVNLEERVAYFEAERNELRKIVKALLAERQCSALELSKTSDVSSMLDLRQGNKNNIYTNNSGSNNNNNTLNSSHGALFLPYHTSSVNAQGNRLRNDHYGNNNNSNSNSVNEGQLYRLLHPDKQSPERMTLRPEFVTAKVSPPPNRSSPQQRSTSHSPLLLKEQSSSTRGLHESNIKYFAEELNKEQVESLPALPYVRTSNHEEHQQQLKYE